MTLLAALALAAATARVESVALTSAGDRLAVRVLVKGNPGMVAMHREGGAARLSILDAQLGLRFAGGTRFSWTQAEGFDPSLLASTPGLERIQLEATPSEVSVLLHVPPEVGIDVSRDARGLLLTFRSSTAAAASMPAAQALPPPRPPAAAAPPAPRAEARPQPASVEAPAPPPVVVAEAPAEPPAPPPVAVAAAPIEPPLAAAEAPASAPVTPSPASAETTELARGLFTAAGGEANQASMPGAGVPDLYAQLFPSGAPLAPVPEPQEEAPVIEGVAEQGLIAGPFRVQASLDAGYINADTFVESQPEPTRDEYLQVTPRIEAAAPAGGGRLVLDYEPTLRAFATFDQVNSSAHRVGASLDLPLGPTVDLRLADRFTSGVLETRVVDPGGEYFFGLGRFNQNDLNASASIEVGPRMSVELQGGLGTVRFQEDSSFFDYDTRSAGAGLGFELGPSLRAIVGYAYDTVPRPDERPEAEATAHSVQGSLIGDILPLLTGRLTVGYRNQDSPNAAEGGQSYSGLTFSGALARQLGLDSTLTIFLSRSTPVSAYEGNAFYVYTSTQGSLRLALPAAFELDTGIGYQWNDYRTVASDIGVPREDRILGWFVGLRRPISRRIALSGLYRREERSSNVDAFDTTADGFLLQLEWDIFGATRR
jgi:hypothetical protein